MSPAVWMSVILRLCAQQWVRQDAHRGFSVINQCRALGQTSEKAWWLHAKPFLPWLEAEPHFSKARPSLKGVRWSGGLDTIYTPYLLYLPLECFLCAKHCAEPLVYYFLKLLLFFFTIYVKVYSFSQLIYFNWRIITILWWLLPYINVSQPQVYMCPLPLEPPSHLPSHPTPLGCHRAPSVISLSNTANTHWLPILHMVIHNF